jgi:cellular nucleic acid-binding protein
MSGEGGADSADARLDETGAAAESEQEWQPAVKPRKKRGKSGQVLKGESLPQQAVSEKTQESARGSDGQSGSSKRHGRGGSKKEKAPAKAEDDRSSVRSFGSASFDGVEEVQSRGSSEDQSAWEQRRSKVRNYDRCGTCGEIGHFKRNCPAKGVRCLKCGNAGHDSANCSAGSVKCGACGQPGHQAQTCPKESTDRERCFRCGSHNHVLHDCPVLGPGKNLCHNCHKPGHISRDCPEPLVLAHFTCRICKEPGHLARDCPQEKRPCHECGSTDHIARNCPRERACGTCGEAGHSPPECPKGLNAKRACRRCGESGHLERKCPYPRDVCWRCKQPGHRSAECTADVDSCNLCGGAGHASHSCPSKQGQGEAQRGRAQNHSQGGVQGAHQMAAEERPTSGVVKSGEGPSFAAALQAGVWESFHGIQPDGGPSEWGQGTESEPGEGGNWEGGEQTWQVGGEATGDAVGSGDSEGDSSLFEHMASAAVLRQKQYAGSDLAEALSQLELQHEAIRDAMLSKKANGNESGDARWQNPHGPPERSPNPFDSKPLDPRVREYVPPAKDSPSNRSKPEAEPLHKEGGVRSDAATQPAVSTPEMPKERASRSLNANSPAWQPPPHLARSAFRGLALGPCQIRTPITGASSRASQDVRNAPPESGRSVGQKRRDEQLLDDRAESSERVPKVSSLSEESLEGAQRGSDGASHESNGLAGSVNGMNGVSDDALKDAGLQGPGSDGFLESLDGSEVVTSEQLDALLEGLDGYSSVSEVEDMESWESRAGLGEEGIFTAEDLPDDDIFEDGAGFVKGEEPEARPSEEQPSGGVRQGSGAHEQVELSASVEQGELDAGHERGASSEASQMVGEASEPEHSEVRQSARKAAPDEVHKEADSGGSAKTEARPASSSSAVELAGSSERAASTGRQTADPVSTGVAPDKPRQPQEVHSREPASRGPRMPHPGFQKPGRQQMGSSPTAWLTNLVSKPPAKPGLGSSVPPGFVKRPPQSASPVKPSLPPNGKREGISGPISASNSIPGEALRKPEAIPIRSAPPFSDVSGEVGSKSETYPARPPSSSYSVSTESGSKPEVIPARPAPSFSSVPGELLTKPGTPSRFVLSRVIVQRTVAEADPVSAPSADASGVKDVELRVDKRKPIRLRTVGELGSGPETSPERVSAVRSWLERPVDVTDGPKGFREVAPLVSDDVVDGPAGRRAVSASEQVQYQRFGAENERGPVNSRVEEMERWRGGERRDTGPQEQQGEQRRPQTGYAEVKRTDGQRMRSPQVRSVAALRVSFTGCIVRSSGSTAGLCLTVILNWHDSSKAELRRRQYSDSDNMQGSVNECERS